MWSSTLALALGLASLASAQDSGSSGGGGGETQPSPVRSHAVIAHATLMGLAFAFLMPLGSIIVRVSSFKRLVWIHATIQIFAYILALTGLGLGVYIGIHPDNIIHSPNGHPIIGIIVVVLLLLQAPLGLFHHYIAKHQARKSLWTLTHVWWGRVLITVAIINGGLGLQLSDNTVNGEIAYGVIAGVIWLVWVAVSATSYFKPMGNSGKLDMKMKRNDGSREDYGSERSEMTNTPA